MREFRTFLPFPPIGPAWLICELRVGMRHTGDWSPGCRMEMMPLYATVASSAAPRPQWHFLEFHEESCLCADMLTLDGFPEYIILT
jgi:hypothetical protein